ncbi:hypothetical protein TKK_0012765 [Trichogramma kaykai]
MSAIIQLLQPLLQDYEQDNHLELLKAEEKLATKLGDNFLSAVYRIAVSGKRKNGSEYRGSFIRKIRLNENQLTKQMRDDKMFENEAYFYNNIYPINGSFAPKPVLATVDQIILEDLGDRGYVVLSRKDLLDFKHTDEVVKAMASMHAFYLSYKLNHPEEFVKLIAPIKENVFPKDDNISPGRFYELGFDTAKKSLETIADSSPQARRGLRFLRFFEKDLYNTLKSMIDPTKNDSKYWTLTHGDLWNNNLMFLQDNQEEILRLKFLDYQVIRHMSPATDFVYLVYSSCKPEVLDRVNELVETYEEYFRHSLSSLNVSDEHLRFFSKRDWFLEEIEQAGLFGMAGALLVMHALTLDDAEIEALKKEQDRKLASQDVNDNELITSTVSLNPQRTERILRNVTNYLHHFGGQLSKCFGEWDQSDEEQKAKF